MKTRLTFLALFISTLMFGQVEYSPSATGFQYIASGTDKVSTPDFRARFGTETSQRSAIAMFNLEGLPTNDSIVFEMEYKWKDAYEFPTKVTIWGANTYEGDGTTIPKFADLDTRVESNGTLLDTITLPTGTASTDVFTLSNQTITDFVNSKITAASAVGDQYLTLYMRIAESSGTNHYMFINLKLKLAKAFSGAGFRDAATSPTRIAYTNQTQKLIIDFVGSAPYKVIYNDGTSDITVDNIMEDSLAIDVNTLTNKTYSIVSVGADGNGEITSGDVAYNYVQQSAILDQSYYIPTGVSTDSMFANIVLDGIAPFDITFSTGQSFTVEEEDLNSINSFVCKVPTEINQNITLTSVTDNVGTSCTLSGTITSISTSGSGTTLNPKLDGFVKGTLSAKTDFTSEEIELRKDGNDYNREAFFTFDLTALSSSDVLSMAYVQLYCTYVNSAGHISYLRLTKVDPTDDTKLDTMTYAGGLQSLSLTGESNQSYFAGIAKSDYTDNTVIIDIKDIINDAINANEDSISLRLDNYSKETAYYKFGTVENPTVEKRPFLYYEIDTSTDLAKSKILISSFYPNPATSTLTFESAQLRTIYSLAGQQVMTSQERIVNISNLNNGVYLIRTGNATERFIKK